MTDPQVFIHSCLHPGVDLWPGCASAVTAHGDGSDRGHSRAGQIRATTAAPGMPVPEQPSAGHSDASWQARSYPVLAVLAPVITSPGHELAYPGDPMCLYWALGLAIAEADRARQAGPGGDSNYPGMCPDWGTAFPAKADRLAASTAGVREASPFPALTDHSVFDPRAWTAQAEDDYRAVLRARRPRVLLISTVSAAHRYALRMAEIAKEYSPGCLVVLGGRHIDETIRWLPAARRLDLTPSSTVQVILDGRARPVVDFLVSGDGAFAASLLMRAISLAMDVTAKTCAVAGAAATLHALGRAGQPVPGTATIVAMDGTSVEAFPSAGRRYELSELPSPYAAFAIRSRFPIFPGRSGTTGKRTAHMMTSTSCPYRCTFCSESVVVTGAIRRGGTARTLARLCEHIHYGAEAAFFDDPVFFAGNFPAVIGFCESLARARESAGTTLPDECRLWLRDPDDRERLRQLEWGAQFTVDLLARPQSADRVRAMLRAARTAGCSYIYLGLESMSDAIMAGIHKNRARENPRPWREKAREALQLVQDAGIRCGSSILFGLDGETRQTIDETIEEIGSLLDAGLLQLASPNVMTYHPAADITTRHGMGDKLDYHSTGVVNYPPYTFFEEAYPGVVSRLLSEDDIWYIHDRAKDRWGARRHGAAPGPAQPGDELGSGAPAAGPPAPRPDATGPAGLRPFTITTAPARMAARGDAMISMAEIVRLSDAHEIPQLDTLLIAVNSAGARSQMTFPRARMQLRPLSSDEAWQVILPLDSPDSPFTLDDDGLHLDGQQVAELVGCENDDVVLTYLRAGGRSITLNTHSRSACTGCLFCPNVIEDASDATLNTEHQLSNLLAWVQADNGWPDLSGVNVITVCTGCFHTADAAIDHMVALRHAAAGHGFTGRLHLLSSVVRERRHLQRLAETAGSFHLTLTLECFTRRNLLLKETKASLTLEKSCEILDDCADLGILGDFTYVTGLDPLDATVHGLRTLAPHCTAFPRIQVFQAHNGYMRTARDPDAASLAFYLSVRQAIEADFATAGLAPISWENYRPLWYSTYAGSPVSGPRV